MSSGVRRSVGSAGSHLVEGVVADDPNGARFGGGIVHVPTWQDENRAGEGWGFAGGALSEKFAKEVGVGLGLEDGLVVEGSVGFDERVGFRVKVDLGVSALGGGGPVLGFDGED